LKLIITDMDNTLYDWVSFYSQSFEAMATKVAEIVGKPLDIILSEYKTIHQKFGNSEKPFASLELPSVIEFFNTNDKIILQEKLGPAFQAFSTKRKETLRLYPEVEDTLAKLTAKGVKIVAHTEALEFNSLYRLNSLNITSYFKHLYTLEDLHSLHPNPKSAKQINVPDDFVVRLPKGEAKPNPELLVDICKREGVAIQDAIYVGDSITKDMSMAKEINMKSAWASYGRDFPASSWKILVKITHWTDEDVSREEELKKAYSDIKPDYVINCFSDLLKI